jgi:hypothetical protein
VGHVSLRHQIPRKRYFPSALDPYPWTFRSLNEGAAMLLLKNERYITGIYGDGRTFV